MTRLTTVLTRGDLPLAELHALRLNGELYGIDDAFAVIDQPEGPGERAAALARYCQQRLIVEQRSAAWVWGATAHPPAKHELCASIGARTRPTNPGRIIVREVKISEDELVDFDGVRVTTPLRTAVDLARFQPDFDAPLVARLLARHHLGVDECVREIHRRRNLPRKKLALARLATVRLAAVDSVHVVDGVDSAHRAQHAVEVGGVAHLKDVAAER